MTSFAEQLKNAKLKKSKEPMKDFSSPKTSGFLSQEEITLYQNCVLDVNTELWMHLLRDVTFPSKLCSIKFDEAEMFVSVYDRLYKNLDPVRIAAIDWRENISADEKKAIGEIAHRLDEVMEKFTTNGGSCFVKTSSRSAKDAPLAQIRFKNMYHEFLSKETKEKQLSENTQITCLLQAAFEAMKVKTAEEVLDMMIRSERIYQDFLLATEIKERFHENFVVRKFVPIDVDMEFRGFVYENELTALSQYNYLIYSKRLVEQKEEIKGSILGFFVNAVKPKLEVHCSFPQNYIIDFAVCDGGVKIWVIEINPFMETTDGALFSWQHERHLLEGKEGFHFRTVNRVKPGAKAMLPTSIKSLLQ